MPTLLLLCTLLSIFVYTEARNPGATLRLSNKGLTYATECVIDKLKRSFLSHQLPDYQDTSGHLSYHLSRIHITSFTGPESSLVTNPGVGVILALTNIGIKLCGDWSYKYRLGFIPIKDSGNFDITVGSASVRLSVNIGADANGRPTIFTRSCHAVADGVDVKFHGGASWIYNLFTPRIEENLADHLRSKLCDDLDRLVNVLARKKLQEMKVLLSIGHYLVMDYSLVANPVLTANYLESLHKGEIYMRKKHTETPFEPMSTRYQPVELKALSVCLTDYILNSAGYALFTVQRQKLTYNLTKKDLPQTQQHILDTGSFSQLAKEFPNSTIELQMFATKPPNCHIINDTVIGGLQGWTHFRIRKPNGELQDWFTLGLKSKLFVNVTLTGHMIIGKVKHFYLKSKLVEKKPDPLPKRLVDMMFHIVFRNFILLNLNELGQNGLPLPHIKDIQYIDSELHLQKGSLCLAVDVKYNPDL